MIKKERIKINAIILAAGYATRLYPLTLNKPKHLLPIDGKPLIEHLIKKLEEINIDKIYIITNNRFYPHFQTWLKNFKSNASIKILNDNTYTNEDRLGAVGDIFFVVEKENINDNLIVLAGDNLFEFSLNDMINMFKQKNCSVIAGVKKPKKEIAGKYGNIILDNNNRIIGFEEKPLQPKSEIAATALYLFNKTALQQLKIYIAETAKPDNLGNFIKYLSEKENIYTHIFKEKWWDIGNKAQLEEINRKYKDEILL